VFNYAVMSAQGEELGLSDTWRGADLMRQQFAVQGFKGAWVKTIGRTNNSRRVPKTMYTKLRVELLERR
jgi:hypothetical protein